MSLILVVKDDGSILHGLQESLHLEDHEVLSANDGESGYQLAVEKKPDLVILDLMLPEMSGFEVCRKLRANGFHAPILMLTARGEEADRVLGLDLGADDYITKPFSVRELLARVRAHLRRASSQNGAERPPDEVRFDDVVVDFRKCEAVKAGRPVKLTRKEFGVLKLLASKSGAVVSRDDLLNEVWGYSSYPTTNTVDVHIALLRAKLESNPSTPCHLVTVHGLGYKLIVS